LEHKFLLGIGAQKAGTSWLAKYLQKHPDVFLSPLKEMHFFDSKYLNEFSHVEKKFEQRRNKLFNENRNSSIFQHLDARIKMNSDIKKYIEYFKKFGAQHAFIGEITPSYSLLKRENFLQIKNDIPFETNVILILRNPIDRFWSQLNFTPSLANNLDCTKISRYLNKKIYWERSNYERLVVDIFEVFDTPNITIAFYENIFSKDLRTKNDSIRKMIESIGIEYHPKLLSTEKKVNKTKSKAKLDENARREAFHSFSSIFQFIAEKEELKDYLPTEWKTDIKKYT